MPAYTKLTMPKVDAERLFDLVKLGISARPVAGTTDEETQAVIADARVFNRVMLAVRGKDRRVSNRHSNDRRGVPSPTEWAAVVGPQVAAVTPVLSLAHGRVLRVRVKTQSWRTELQAMGAEILDKLNADREQPYSAIQFYCVV